MLGVGMAGRAALTIALGVVVYAVALRWFAPDITRRAIVLFRRLLAKVIGARRRRVLQP
jgi:hypothetical protein